MSRYQFALLLCLKELCDVKVHVYDPVFRETEQLILKQLDCNILKRNLEGKYRNKNCNTTLFLLPHCPKQLSNNLLWANWGLNLSRCLVISNSFTQIVENTPKRFLIKSAEYISNILPYTLELAVINSFKYYNVFNDMAIHVFPMENIRLISTDFWHFNEEPVYSEDDIEFITNKTQFTSVEL